MFAVEGCSVLLGPCWPAAPSFVAKSRSHHHRRNYLRLTFAVGSRLPSTEAPQLEIFSRSRHGWMCMGTASGSPGPAYIERTFGAENVCLGNVHRKELEARIRKQLQHVTVSPSAYDTAWVSMVPLLGYPLAPRFPQCIEWIMQNQKDNGSWGNKNLESSVSKDVLLSTLACVIALKKWNMGAEHVERGMNSMVLPVDVGLMPSNQYLKYFYTTKILPGLRFIGSNFSIVMNKQITAPAGFSLIFPGMLSIAIGMGLEFPAIRRTDTVEILYLWKEDLERLSVENSFGTKAYIAYVSEGLGILADWSEVLKFQQKNGSLFNSLSTTAALLVHKYDDKALQFLSSVVSEFGSAVPTVYPLNIRCQLSMVDSLEKVGISRLFSSEIKSILDMTYSLWLQRDDKIMIDFATCSIAFRLLRMNGYSVSADELSHVEGVATFHNSIQGYLNDLKSLLELYKASEVSICENERILDNICYWSGNLLREQCLDRLKTLRIFREIQHALKFPFYTTLERLDHKRNIENFDASDSQNFKTEHQLYGVNEDILSLAAQDFTHSQSIYQDELVKLDCWVKEHKLDKLQFARQKLTYSYLCAAGSITPNELFEARISIAKNIVLLTVVDDFFDGGGSREELKDLIALVEKWDEHDHGKLYTEKVQILFSGLYSTVKELASMVSAAQNYDVTEYMIDTWLHVLRSMMIEAEWRMNKYVPTIEEYTKNAVVSVALGPIVLSAVYSVGEKLPKCIVKDQDYSELLQLTSTCARLLNDIQGLERDEGSEGKLNSVSLVVHHSGGSIPIEMAKLAIRKSIITTTKDLLRLVLSEECVIPKPCKEVFWKICKIPHFFYYETDGYSSPQKMDSAVNALIYEPLKLPRSQSII